MDTLALHYRHSTNSKNVYSTLPPADLSDNYASPLRPEIL